LLTRFARGKIGVTRTVGTLVAPAAAQARVDEGGVGQPNSSSEISSYVPGVTDFPSAVQHVEGSGPMTMPQAMLDDYAAAQEAGGADIEAVRAARTAAPDPTSGIENVRVGGTVTPDPSAAIETVRAGRTAPEADDGGITISAPSTGEAAAMAGAGAAALAIAGAAFALRRKGQPEPV
jgi:hypothetical protein